MKLYQFCCQFVKGVTTGVIQQGRTPSYSLSPKGRGFRVRVMIVLVRFPDVMSMGSF